MVARIAPSPITTSVAIGDASTHGPSASASSAPQGGKNAASQFATDDAGQRAAAPPVLPSPPGEAFAAAVIAGQLPPMPVTQEQLKQRLGAAWQPPTSALRLMDRVA